MPVIASNKPLHELDDEALVERIQRQPKERSPAFSVLLYRHQDGLLRYCLSRLGNRQDAEDALQETVLRAYRGIQGFRGEASFRTWLHTIADNRCKSLAERRAKQIMSDHLRELIHQHETLRRERKRPLKSDLQAVHSVLAALPATAQDVLMLRFFCELRIEQIAQLLGIGLSAAKMRLYRAQEEFSLHYSQRMTA